ncbi:MAG: phosphatidate cytidylyltransferase [Clostridiales bacterium]|nr:phosphatidate cytidylyltransferase [Clostridiales bacterium]
MLFKRVVSAAVGILYLIIVLYFRGCLLNISVLAITLLGMYEFYTSIRRKGYKPISLLGYLYIIVLFYFIVVKTDSIPGIIITVIAAMICIFYNVVNIQSTAIDASFTIMGFVYPGMALLSLLILGNLTQPYYHYLLVFTLIATWSTDTFAYFTGIKFGKNKLCPDISPKKTVEGSLGGLTGSVIAGIVTGWVLNSYFNVSIGYHHYVIMSLICGITSQAGDLTASSIKRFCGIKDFGHIFPGHGGILDRFDSIMFTVPAICTYYFICLI